ncbi:MAG: flagellar export chaperone FliS [Kofleriaceae bacterium]
MHARAANAYRRVDLESAPKQDVLGRLFERFAADVTAARTAIAAKDIAGKAAALDHALRIVGELEASLDHNAAPALCAQLQALYRFVADELTKVNRSLDPKGLDAPAKIMNDLAAAFRDAQARR